jgi:O-antigen/teichoic acid export membrane protein
MLASLHRLVHTLLPDWIYQRLIGNWDKDGFKKYFNNTSWMALARIISLIISFLTIAIIARYLGPENYGKLSYTQNFVALFSAFAALGLDQILYRDLIAEKEKEAELLGTAFVLRAVFGGITLIATILTAVLLNEDIVLTWMVGIIALSFIFQPFGVIGHLFNARVLAKYTSYITIIVAFLLPSLKLLVVYFDKGILYFSITIALEALIYAIAYVYLYRKILGGSPLQWSVSLVRAKTLLLQSWPLFLASFSGYIYGRIDQVMIQQFIDSTAVGFYDVAVRLTELLGFVPGIIIASLFPALINAKNESNEKYYQRFRAITFLCAGISFVSALLLFCLAPFIISMLFGPEFAAAISVTRLYVWSTIGTVLIILIQQHFIAQKQSARFLFFSLLGASTNILLNFLLIPIYGIYGAASATLITLSLIILVFWVAKNGIVARN